MSRLNSILLATTFLVLSCGGGSDSSGESFIAEVSTVAGTGEAGADDGLKAEFNYPRGMVVDGDNIYVADTNNHALRKIAVDATNADVSTLLNSGLSYPFSLAKLDKEIYILNHGDSSLVSYNIETRGVNRYDLAGVDNPYDLAVKGKIIYISDNISNQIKSFDTEAKTVSFVAGSTVGYKDGTSGEAMFNSPRGLAISGDILYVADFFNNRIRALNLAENKVSTIVGTKDSGSKNGKQSEATFWGPADIEVVSSTIYVADSLNNLIRKVDSKKVVSYFAGSKDASADDGKGTKASFNNPSFLVAASDKLMYVGDTDNHKIRKIKLAK